MKNNGVFTDEEINAIAKDPEILEAASRMLNSKEMELEKDPESTKMKPPAFEEEKDERSIGDVLHELKTNADERDNKFTELKENFPEIKSDAGLIIMDDLESGREVVIGKDTNETIDKIMNDFDSPEFNKVREIDEKNIDAREKSDVKYDMSNAKENAIEKSKAPEKEEEKQR